jgi:hypothetical protein
VLRPDAPEVRTPRLVGRVSPSAHPPVIRVWPRRTRLASVVCLCVSGIAGCGGSAARRTEAANGGSAARGPGTAFVTFYCPLNPASLSPAEQTLFARAGVDRALCAATDATWNVVVRALGQLAPGQQASLDALADASSVSASSPQAGAALEITDGVLAGATLRALPAPPATTVKPAALPGQPSPNPIISALIRDAVDPASDPPCVPEKSKDEQSGLGESIVQATTEALLRHASFPGVVLAVAHELANDQFCEKLDELLEQLRRAYNTVTDPDLIARLVTAQAQVEGLHDVPPVATAAYALLRQRAIRAYILSGQLTEAEELSGGEAALKARLLAVRADEPRGTGDSAILDEDIHADSTIGAEEAR